MNLVDELLNADPEKAKEKKTDVVKSEHLALILGKKNPVDVEVTEIAYRKMADIAMMAVKKDGQVDYSKAVDSQIKTALAGVTNIDFKNDDLMKHFNCATPIELCEKLFGSDLPKISDRIQSLSGFNADESEDIETIKN